MEKELRELIAAAKLYIKAPGRPTTQDLKEAIRNAEMAINSAREETKSVNDNEAKKEVCDHEWRHYNQHGGLVGCTCTKCGLERY